MSRIASIGRADSRNSREGTFRISGGGGPAGGCPGGGPARALREVGRADGRELQALTGRGAADENDEVGRGGAAARDEEDPGRAPWSAGSPLRILVLAAAAAPLAFLDLRLESVRSELSLRSSLESVEL